jgi:DNA invertase Pin-like site-specific DNA recombinase
MTETHLQNRRLGYARVSTYGQTLDVQLEQLRGAGCTKIYREKVTGAHSDRRQLLKMLDTLVPGDVVTVTRIDRLARSTFDLFAIVKQIVDAKAQFRSLAEPWADTGTSTGRLMIAVLGGLADVERDLIRTRTAEGRSRARNNGHMVERARNRLRKRAKKGLRGYPVATVALYGPDDTRATKLTVGIVPAEDVDDATDVQRWFSEGADIRNDAGVAEEVLVFIDAAGARSIVMTDRIIGCPHEEGTDYEGRSATHGPAPPRRTGA